MYRTDNPLADWNIYCADEERELKKLPKCEICGERITDDYLYNIEGELMCEECLKNQYRKKTEDYIKEN